MSWLKTIVKGLLTAFALCFLFYLVQLYAGIQEKIHVEAPSVQKVEIYGQLQFLKSALHQGAGKEMQGLFPEGFIFIQVLYGLTWCDWLQDIEANDPRLSEGLTEIDWTLSEMQSDYGRQIFHEKLPLPYGAFYRGWTNYLLAKKLQLQNPIARDTQQVIQFQENCEAIAQAFENAESPYLNSYYRGTWPADNLVAMASLSLHDQILPPRYDSLQQVWLTKVKKRLDPATGLIPHSVQDISGFPLEGARGSSQSLMNIFLQDINPDFGRAQFSLYRELFLDYRLGLPGIREYPKGTAGGGDIDSGPMLLDIGGAASIVGIRTMALYGDEATNKGLKGAVEGFGMGRWHGVEKRYIGNWLPMADAFIAWSNVAKVEQSAADYPSEMRPGVMNWCLLVMALVTLGLLLWLWWSSAKRRLRP